MLQTAEGSHSGPKESPEVVVVGVRVNGGLLLLSGHGLPDGHPLDGEPLDRAETAWTNGQRKGDEGVEVVYIEDGIKVEDVGCFGVDGAACA
jgi:hypothetical protein